jgi:hypothetical protein
MDSKTKPGTAAASGAGSKRKLAAEAPMSDAPNADRIDPYLHWAKATNFEYLGGAAALWFPVLIEVGKGTASEFATFVSLHPDFLASIQVPSIFMTPPKGLEQSKFLSAHVSRDFLVNFLGNPAVRLDIRRFELGSPVLPVEMGIPGHALRRRPFGKKAAGNAVVAVIDDGLAFAHERFRDASGGTRFRHFWNQDAPTLNPPPFAPWGQEFDDVQINNWMAACKHSGMVDEDAVYRLANQALTARRAKHGTHVMDLACGLDPQSVTVKSPYLIGVQLPKWTTLDTSGSLLTPVVLEALYYILQRADDIAVKEGTAQLPVVVNLSYGLIAGPHDGSLLLERAIDFATANRPAPLMVVLPAGNHHLARCHGRFSLPAGSVRKTRWRVQPDNQSCSFMETWLPPAPATQPVPSVEIRVTTPTGVKSPWTKQGQMWLWPSPLDVRFMLLYFNPFTYPQGMRSLILLGMAPTAAVDPPVRTAPSGDWLVEVRAPGTSVADIHAWIQRGDTPFGYPLRGRQSRFEDPAYVRFDRAGRLKETDDPPPAYVVRAGTINALATGSMAAVIGGFRRSDYTASRYSGAGPIVDWPAAVPYRVGPDVTAVADDSVVLRGVLAAGTRSGSRFAMNGSSVAAPQITRLISRLMTFGFPAGRAQVQAIGVSQDAGRPQQPLPPNRGGAGRIEMPPIERVKRRS